MDAVVFDGTPHATESLKESAPETRVFGAMIFADELARALVRYGTADRYVHFNRNFNEVLQSGPVDGEAFSNGARTSEANPSTIEALRRLDQVALLTFRAFPQNFVPMRRRLGKAWPIVCPTAALSGPIIPTLVSEMITRDLCEYDAVLSPTNAARRALQNLLEQAVDASGYDGARRPTSAARLPVIPLGIDCAQADGDREEARRALLPDDHADPRTTVILSVGRLTPHAKADLGPLICCFQELRQQTPEPLLLILAGDDTRHHMADELRRYARELGCGSAVRVLPNVSVQTKWRLYAAADIFVSLSDHIQESFGIALVEALAAGLPVVASNWSGYREVVDDGVTGFLVPTSWIDLDGALELVSTATTLERRNTVLAGMTIVDDLQLFTRLQALVADPALRKRMGDQGRRIARERYDWSRIIPQYDALFAELLAARPAGAAHRADAAGPFAYDVQEIFAHYPCGIVRPDTVLAVAPRGRRWLVSRFPLSTLPDYPIDEGAVAAALRHASEPGTTARVETLIDVLAARHNRTAAAWLLSRLFKYGLLRAEVPGQPPQSR